MLRYQLLLSTKTKTPTQTKRNQKIMIREVSLQDIDPCADLFVSIFSNPPWNETWSIDGAKRRLSDCFLSANFFGILMEDSADLHGFAFGNIQYYGLEKHYYLLELCIRTDRQRQGIGGRIMTAWTVILISWVRRWRIMASGEPFLRRSTQR